MLVVCFRGSCLREQYRSRLARLLLYRRSATRGRISCCPFVALASMHASTCPTSTVSVASASECGDSLDRLASAHYCVPIICRAQQQLALDRTAQLGGGMAGLIGCFTCVLQRVYRYKCDPFYAVHEALRSPATVMEASRLLFYQLSLIYPI